MKNEDHLINRLITSTGGNFYSSKDPHEKRVFLYLVTSLVTFYGVNATTDPSNPRYDRVIHYVYETTLQKYET